MLERHTELIERLLRDSLTRTSEFNQALSFTDDGTLYFTVWDKDGSTFFSWSERQPGLVWFCGPGVLRVVGCYWWCCAHWRAYWLGESQPSALWGCSSL